MSGRWDHNTDMNVEISGVAHGDPCTTTKSDAAVTGTPPPMSDLPAATYDSAAISRSALCTSGEKCCVGDVPCSEFAQQTLELFCSGDYTRCLKKCTEMLNSSSTVTHSMANFLMRCIYTHCPKLLQQLQPVRTVDPMTELLTKAMRCSKGSKEFFLQVVLRAIDSPHQNMIATGEYLYGMLYDKGLGVERDMTLAVKHYAIAARHLHSMGMYNLGWCLKNGEGAPANRDEALRLYTKAADLGNPMAQINLGYCYKNADGVEKDLAKSLTLYRLSAEQGNAWAQNNLALMYQNGDGVPKDHRDGFRMYHSAAIQGNAMAQNNIGVCFENGTGCERNLEEAVRWYKLSVSQDVPLAERNLAACYEYSKGTSRDVREAVRLYKLAFAGGDDESRQRLRRLTKYYGYS
ncbi:sel1 repeat family protein [Pelomyxa schiedti]|nr:sel1 repeat family protein [Pelomyxa schiedti]